jgi:hypothetical protein
MAKRELKSKVLRGGILRCIHIFVPVLHKRQTEGGDEMIWAVRSSIADSDGSRWNRMILCRKVEWNGPTKCVEHFNDPLPGTGGRGVAVVYTEAELTIYWDAHLPEPQQIRVEDKPAVAKAG